MAANNVNLGTARVYMAAILHTFSNDYRFPTFGAIAGVNDRMFDEIRGAITPLERQPNARQWKKIESRDIPILHVDLTYHPQGAGVSGLSERTRTDNSPVEASNPVTMTIKYDYYNEKHFRQDIRKELLEPRAQDYLNQYLAGKMRLDAPMAQAMANIGAKMYRDMEPILFRPYNKWILSQLVAGIGKNKAYPTASTPSAGAPIITVPGFRHKGVEKLPVVNPQTALMNTKTMNKFRGKGVLIGGAIWLEWHRAMKYMVANADGLDFAKAYAQLPWVFYYDEHIDSEFGEGNAIYIDPGAVAFEQISNHDRRYTFLPEDAFEVDDTTLGSLYLNIAQYNEGEPGLANIQSTLPFAMDLRVQRNMDSNDIMTKIWKPSISAGRFIRPKGYFTSVTSDVLHDVTGVYAFKMTDGAEV